METEYIVHTGSVDDGKSRAFDARTLASVKSVFATNLDPEQIPTLVVSKSSNRLTFDIGKIPSDRQEAVRRTLRVVLERFPTIQVATNDLDWPVRSGVSYQTDTVPTEEIDLTLDDIDLTGVEVR